MLYELPTAVAALVLFICWIFESIFPAVWPTRSLGDRLHHLALGGLNTIPAAFVAGGITLLETDSPTGLRELLGQLGFPVWFIGLCSFILLDFFQYACHVFMHKIPWLWRLHLVHHHAVRVESTTAFRFHTLEIIAQGIMLAPFMVISGVCVHDIALYNAILIPMSLFHHANVRLPRRIDRLIGLLIVTPGIHRLRHARWQKMPDSNYGAVLSVWDRCFCTLSFHSRPERVPVGLDGFGPQHTNTIGGMLRTPFSGAHAEMGNPPDDKIQSVDDPRVSPACGGRTQTPQEIGSRIHAQRCNQQTNERVYVSRRKESSR